MPTDLLDRLAEFGEHLDAERAAERTTPRLAQPVTVRSRRAWVGLAAAGLAIVGMVSAIALLRQRDDNRSASTPPDTVSVGEIPAAATTISLPQPTDDWASSPFDPIRIAPGTIGWFEATNLPPGLARQRVTFGPAAENLSVFFRCVEWSADDDGPICVKLAGGNGVEHVKYGEKLAVGTSLGTSDVAAMSEALVRGGLVGYEEALPAAAPVEIGTKHGLLSRKDDRAYLVWEYQPDAVVWLSSTGIDDSELIDIAAGVRPAALPDRLPVLLQLSPTVHPPTTPGGVDMSGGLKLGWFGGRPCVGLTMYESCTPIDRPAIIPLARWGDGTPDQVAAVAPAGSGLTLNLTLSREVPLVQVPLAPAPQPENLEYAVYDVGKERLIEAALIDAGGKEVTAPFVQQDPGTQFAGQAIIAEGRSASVAWIVRRQDPTAAPSTTANEPSVVYMPNETAEYCLVLEGPEEFAPLCPPAAAPPSGLGERADYHATLDLVEVGADVGSLTCAGEAMSIFADPQLAGRRFAVISCEDPGIG